jgi:hypothetical protein
MTRQTDSVCKQAKNPHPVPVNAPPKPPTGYPILSKPETERIVTPSHPRGLSRFLVVAVGLLVFAGHALGQEALQMSLAGDLAAERQRQAQNSIGYYNLLLGPVALRFSTGMEFDYDDNVHLTQNGEGDLIFRPNVNAQMHWPVTQKNSLDVSLGAGYSLYATHSELNQFYMNPGSGLSFNIYAGDCVINLHDRISVTEYAYQNPAAGGNGNYAQLENTIGASTFWDLNKLVMQLGYDHDSDVSIGSGQALPDATSENFYANAGVIPIPEITVGVEGGLGLIRFDQSQSREPDAMQWNAGAFCKAQISQYITGRFDIGYTVYSPASTGAFTNLNDAANFYFQFSASHQVNKFISYTLSAGRSTDSSFYGQPYDYYFVRWQPAWNIFRKYQLSTPFWWQKGTRLYFQGVGADFDQYGLGINIGRSITRKLSGSLGYQRVRESSSLSSLNYTANIVSLNFSYQF